MARKQPLRPNGMRVEPGHVVGVADAVDAATSAAHLRQGETALAAAVLLPMLDRAGAGGHVPSRLAAAVLRAMQPAPDSMGQRGALDHLAGTVRRLTALVREQDGQLARMQAMLDGLL